MTFIRYTLLFFMLSVGFFSCKKSILVDPIIEKKDSVIVVINKPKEKFYDENTWIYSQMKKNYLWESKMPAEKDTDKNLEPVLYYKSLIYNEKDWFSYMKSDKDDVLNFWYGAPYAFGLRYKAFKSDPAKEAVFLAVSYVPIYSAAQKAGIKRGDIIEKINGADILPLNLPSIFSTSIISVSYRDTSNTLRTINLTKTPFPVKPIEVAKVIELEKKKIGYFAFTQFLSNIDDDLRKVFGDFKKEKLDEFILDLRFNPGGFTPNAEVVASLIVKNLNPNEKMFSGLVNAYQSDLAIKLNKNVDGRKWINEANNLGNLNRVYILTSKTSSSSSELVINCLKTKMEVVLVGDNTFGKAVISTILIDSTNKFPFVLMPAFSTLENAKGEAFYARKEGFQPDYKVEDNVLPYFQLGDINETLLKKTLEIISGKKIQDKLGVKLTPVNFTDSYHHYDSHSPFISN